MEQPVEEPVPAEPVSDIHSEIEVRQHRLPDGYFPTKSQLFAAIMDIKVPPESSE